MLSSGETGSEKIWSKQKRDKDKRRAVSKGCRVEVLEDEVELEGRKRTHPGKNERANFFRGHSNGSSVESS